jgi:hypothetical protein
MWYLWTYRLWKPIVCWPFISSVLEPWMAQYAKLRRQMRGSCIWWNKKWQRKPGYLEKSASVPFCLVQTPPHKLTCQPGLWCAPTSSLVTNNDKLHVSDNGTCTVLLLFVTCSRSRNARALLYLFPRPGRNFSTARSFFSWSRCFSLCLSFLCRRSLFLSEEVRSAFPITSPFSRPATTEHYINRVLQHMSKCLGFPKHWLSGV